MKNYNISVMKDSKKQIFQSIEELVGNTPMMELTKYEKENACYAHILGKLEWYNPTGSIKDRAALNMILSAKKEGILHKGDTIVEQTSGNTGIALAAFANRLGYRMEIFLERGASLERREFLEAYGVRLLDYKDAIGLRNNKDHEWIEPDREATLKEIEEYCHKNHSYFINQVINKHNPEAHVLTTGPEIWSQTDGKIDYLVCMAGTGGTLSGLGKYLKDKNPDLKIILAQPDADSCLTHKDCSKPIIDGVLPIFEVDERELTDFQNKDLCDGYVNVATEDAYEVARKLAKSDGLLIGTSSAASLLVATQIAQKRENEGKNIVVIMPDNGTKYLSTKMFE